MAVAELTADPWARLVAGVVLGLIAGSFLATLAIRWPRGQSVSVGRSRCDHCGVQLGSLELVPVLGFAVSRGRCRHCAGEIARSHLWMEIAAASIGGASVVLYPGWGGVWGALMGWLLLVLAMLDLQHFWLPDRLTLPLLASGLAAAWATGTPRLLDSLIGAVAGWAALAAIAAGYRLARGRVGIGGGDPKLFAGIGAWLGWQALPIVLLAAALFGLAVAGAMRLRGREVTRTTQLPLGTLLAAAAWPIWLVGVAR